MKTFSQVSYTVTVVSHLLQLKYKGLWFILNHLCQIRHSKWVPAGIHLLIYCVPLHDDQRLDIQHHGNQTSDAPF